MKKKDKSLMLLLWLARITATISAGFLLFMVLGHLFGNEPHGNPPTTGEMVALAFFPTGLILGLLLGWKWEGLGGAVVIGSMLCFHIAMFIMHGTVEFYGLIDALAVPGLLYLLYWYLSKQRLANSALSA